MIRAAALLGLGLMLAVGAGAAAPTPAAAQDIFRPQTPAEREAARKLRPVPPKSINPIDPFRSKPYTPRDAYAQSRGMGLSRLKMATPTLRTTPTARLRVPAGPPRRR